MYSTAIKVVTADQMRAMDACAIEQAGIPGVVLMENAGRSVVDAIEDHFDLGDQIAVAIFCGKGNNGGDGFVVARHLLQRGHDPVVYLLADFDELAGDAATNARIARYVGVEIIQVRDEEALTSMEFEPSDYDLIVDAIFGTGLTSAARGHFVGVIDLINSSGLPVVAVDIPSGMASDTGELIGPCVEADLTVTFAYPKLGHVLPPADSLCGDLVLADISMPRLAEAEAGELNTYLLTAQVVAPLLQPREQNTHKGTYGHLLVVAGSRGKGGAAAMVGRSALLSGAGLVTVGVPESMCGVVDRASLETMTLPLPQEMIGVLASDAYDALVPALEDKTAVAVGPGTTTSAGTAKTIQRLVGNVKVPLIIDADGVNAFAGQAQRLRSDDAPIIITPHPGEMARLLGVSAAKVQADRVGITRSLAQRNGLIVVLKGHRTVVAAPGGEVFINMSGNPGMATAGAGDVLTGMIAGLAAQPAVEPLEAVLLGVFLHGYAGDIAAEFTGETSLMAGDIMDALPEAFQRLGDGDEEE